MFCGYIFMPQAQDQRYLFIRDNRKYGGMVEWPLNVLREQLDSGFITADTDGKTLCAPGVY